MGQVLCDARWPTRTSQDPVTLESFEYPTWADVEYRFWDMWVGKKPLPFMPGEFFYKGIGPVITIPDEYDPDESSVLPYTTDRYIMGVYGSRRTPGKDALGDIPVDHLIEMKDHRRCRHYRTNYYQPAFGSELDSTGKEGSPISCSESSYSLGNPNGIRDGVILILEAGVDR